MRDFSKLQRFFAVLLLPLSFVYRFGFALCRTLHRRGVLRRYEFSPPVVSIGNITMGGTGKTPFVIYLARMFGERRRKAAIVSRGYGRRDGGGLIDLGKHRQTDSGDEPWLIARKTAAPVIVASKKHLGCAYAVETYAPDVLILDDGFQTFSIQRDMDIVLIDATEGFRAHHLIPAGVYREHFSAISRADAVILTRCNQAGEKGVRILVRSIRKVSSTIALFRSSHEVVGLVRKAGDEPMEPAMLRGKRIVSVSGIANNASFLHSLSEAGLDAVYASCFLDHHRYTARDMGNLSEVVRAHGAEAIVTTEKDLYTLRSFAASSPVPLFALAIRIVMHEEERFVQWCRGKGIL